MTPSERSIATVSTMPPLRCGIAAYSADLCAALTNQKHLPYALHYGGGDWQHCNGDADVNSKRALRKLAQQINASGCDVLNLQHEFGIWGGVNGSNLVAFLEDLKKPIVTTFHTTYDGSEVDSERDDLLELLAARSRASIALTPDAQEYLSGRLGVPSGDIFNVPHGVPSVGYIPPPCTNDRSGRLRLCSIGYLRPDKGIERTLFALRQLADYGLEFEYTIAGGPQPQFVDQLQYAEKLRAQISQLRLDPSVRLWQGFLTQREQIEAIQAADVCIFAYQTPFHSSSGAIPLAIACGRPVICTPISYARNKHLEVSDAVMLCDTFCEDGIARALTKLRDNAQLIPALAELAWKRSRKWEWPRVAELYTRAFDHAVACLGSAMRATPNPAVNRTCAKSRAGRLP